MVALEIVGRTRASKGMAREIILDTETTGFEPKQGHRLVEIGCIELVDFLPTGQSFHCYVDPERDMPPEAEKVHGLSAAFLKGKPKFAHTSVCDAFLEFIGDAPLIAHNAQFDRNFINHELEKAGKPTPKQAWIDTLGLAQKRFPGMYNSLDALCKRFNISLAEREKHGALIDTKLLAAVYLELNGGRERRLELTSSELRTAVSLAKQAAYGARPRPLAPRSTQEERAAHVEFVRSTLKDKAVWLKMGLE
jgi:DNA polymerase-3 subunit epsilon